MSENLGGPRSLIRHLRDSFLLSPIRPRDYQGRGGTPACEGQKGRVNCEIAVNKDLTFV